MVDRTEIKHAIELISKYPENFAWEDFTDKGNSCIGRYEDGYEESINLGTVKLLIPKYGIFHIKLNKSVAKLLHLNYVTYDWLIKTVSRIVSCDSYANFLSMVKLSEVQKRMKI